jgi:hypothetical protein
VGGTTTGFSARNRDPTPLAYVCSSDGVCFAFDSKKQEHIPQITYALAVVLALENRPKNLKLV